MNEKLNKEYVENLIFLLQSKITELQGRCFELEARLMTVLKDEYPEYKNKPKEKGKE